MAGAVVGDMVGLSVGNSGLGGCPAVNVNSSVEEQSTPDDGVDPTRVVTTV